MSFVQDVDGALHVHQRESAVANASFLHPWRRIARKPRRPNVIPALLTPVLQVVCKNQAVEVIDEYVRVILKRLVERPPHQQVIVGGDRAEKSVWKLESSESRAFGNAAL